MKTAIATRVGFSLLFSFLVFAFGACQRGPVAESNLNTNLSTNANLTPANTNTTAQPIATLAAREPDKYKATLVFMHKLKVATTRSASHLFQQKLRAMAMTAGSSSNFPTDQT